MQESTGAGDQIGDTSAALLEGLYAAAERKGVLGELRQKTTPRYLKAVLSHTSGEAIPEALECVLTALHKGRARILTLERKLDRAHFQNIVTGGYHRIAGRTLDGRAIYWLRAGAFGHNVASTRKVRTGSSKFSSVSRAYLWFVELAYIHSTNDPLCSGGIAIVYDFTGMEWLDNCIPCGKSTFEHYLTALPNTGEHTFVFGMSPILSAFMGVLSGLTNRSNYFRFPGKKSAMLDMLQDASEAPSWFLNPSEKLAPCTDRKQTWDYKRCMLPGKNPVRLSDIVVPSENVWDYVDDTEGECESSRVEDNDMSVLMTSKRQKMPGSRLEAIQSIASSSRASDAYEM